MASTWSPYDKAPAQLRRSARTIWAALGLNADLASKVRYELDMALLRAHCRLSIRQRITIGRLTTQGGLKVHLGCGNAVLSGWVNLDCYPPPRDAVGSNTVLTRDLRQPIPLRDGTVAALFSEHFLEHLPFEHVRSQLLPDIRRLMQPGGVIRLAVPNGEYFIEQYLAARNGGADPSYVKEQHGATPMMMLNDIAHGFGHHFVYDFETLARILRDAGFGLIQRSEAGITQYRVFEGMDRDDPWRVAMSLYVEAQVEQAGSGC